MPKRLYLPLFAFLACLLPALAAEDPTVEQIIERSREAFEMDVHSELELFRLVNVDSLGDVSKHLVLNLNKRREDGNWLHFLQVLSPQDVSGTTALVLPGEGDKTQTWLYLPALGKARQVKGDGGGRILNSSFRLEDLQRELEAEHDYRRLPDSKVGKREVYVVEATPANEGTSAYSRRILYFDQSTYYLYQVDFYSDDERVKRLEVYDYQSPRVDGSTLRPFRAIMTDYAMNATSTLTILRSRLNLELDDKYFDPERLTSLSLDEIDPLLSALD